MPGLQVIGALACIILTIECALKAVGIRNQAVFAPGRLWIWWLAAPGWAYYAYRFIAL